MFLGKILFAEIFGLLIYVCRKVEGGSLFDISSFIQANNTGMSELDIRRAFAVCDRDKSGDLDMSEYSQLHAGLETEQEPKQGRNKQKRKPDGASARLSAHVHVHIRHCLKMCLNAYCPISQHIFLIQ